MDGSCLVVRGEAVFSEVKCGWEGDICKQVQGRVMHDTHYF